MTPPPRRETVLFLVLMGLAGVMLMGTVCLIVGVVVFYAEEDWRGKKDWQNYKHKLEVRGESLDWVTHTPAPVPDDQNIFKAPRMEEWFAGGYANDLTTRLSPPQFSDFLQRSNINTVGELTVVSSDAKVSPGDADIVLQYNPPFLNLAEASAPPAKTSDPHNGVIPLIVMDQVALLDGIKAIAHEMRLNYSLDPDIPWTQTGPNGKPVSQPYVSLRWTNITAHQALTALLNNYNLQLIESPGSIARVASRALSGAKVVTADAAVSEQMNKLLQAALGTGTNGPLEPAAVGSLCLALFDRPLGKIKPLHVIVRAEKVPTDAEISQFFPTNALAAAAPSGHPLRATALAGNSFRLTIDPESYTCAANYLAWSDQFEPEFDVMREALKRPYARMGGDYSRPFDLPHPNYNTLRLVVQTLTQRAQCHLLIARPDQALRELTLVHNLCRLVKAPPTTVILAMYDVAISGLYANVVAGGTRLHAWQEPQLLKLQEQLKEVDLLPSFANGLNLERVAWCGFFETATPLECRNQLAQFTDPQRAMLTNSLQQLQDPVCCLFNLAPYGWTYENMLCMADYEQKIIDGLDLKNHVILPHQLDEAHREIRSAIKHFSPRTFLASQAFRDTTRGVITLAQNQTLVNEAQVACALERYRLIHDCYPETLDVLTPQFIDKIPLDIIGGQLLKYRVDKTQFTLYSVGWNEKDDGGINGFNSDGSPSQETADWVWPNRGKPHR